MIETLVLKCDFNEGFSPLLSSLRLMWVENLPSMRLATQGGEVRGRQGRNVLIQLVLLQYSSSNALQA